MIKDSIIFVYENSNKNFGHCYNINDGTELSTILTRGKAAYEMMPALFRHNKFYKDSIQFYDEEIGVVKTFAVNDIITKQLGDRKFSTVNIPDSIVMTSFIKTDNAIIGYNRSAGKDRNSMENKFFCYDGKKIVYFGEVKDELIEAVPETSAHRKRSDLEYFFAANGNKVVAANIAGIMLQVIDTDKKTIDFERFYNKVLHECYIGTNGLFTNSVSCDDKCIYSHVRSFVR